MKSIKAWITGLCLLVVTSVAPAQASDDVFAALAQRGLAPWPEEFLAEAPFAPTEEGEGVLDANGFKIRLPRPVKAQIAVVAVPGRVVIVDIHDKTGPLALSERALTGLELSPGDRPQPLQILALRPLEKAPATGPQVATAPSDSRLSTAPQQAPIPRTPARAPSFALSEPSPEAPPFLPAESERPAEPAEPSEGTFATIQIGENINTVMNAPAVPTKEPAPTDGALALQAGVFGQQENAQRFAKSLKDQGIPSSIVPQKTSGGTQLWRVLAGPFTSERARRSAKKRGGRLLTDAYPVPMP